MALSHDLISQFAKLMNNNQTANSGSVVYGTVGVDVDADEKYVILDGSDQKIPITETSANAKAGQRVSVLVKDHTAVVTGNTSSPAASNEDVETAIAEFDIVLAERIEADIAYIKELRANFAEIEELIAAYAEIEELIAAYAEIEELIAGTITAEEIETDLARITVLLTEYIETEYIKAAYAEIEELLAGKITAEEIDVELAKILNLIVENAELKYATIENLNAAVARIGTLEADVAKIDELEADVAYIEDLMFGEAAGKVISTKFANAVVAMIGTAQIKSAMIENITAAQITAGDILTNNVRVVSDDGRLLIADETIQISDANRARVQIGKDASGDYSINIWDADGNLMFSEGGITGEGIKDAIIRDDMVAGDANIDASKLDIASLFETINENNEYTLKSSRIYFDDTDQSLNAVFQSIQQEVDENGDAIGAVETSVASLTTSVNGINATIAQQTQDIGSLNTKYTDLKATVDGISSTVVDHDARITDTETRMSTAESEIVQLNNEISLRVTYEEAVLEHKIVDQGSTSVKLQNVIADDIKNIRICGTTTQDGTPAPTAPVYFTNTGDDGSVTVTVNETQESLTIPTPNGLPGIPVYHNDSAYAVTYTDINGQKWICDEIDMERGVYVHRLFSIVLDGSETWTTAVNGDFLLGALYYGALYDFGYDTNFNDAFHLCSHFRAVGYYQAADGTVVSSGTTVGIGLKFKHSGCADLDSWKAYLAAQAAAGTPVTLWLRRSTPVETPLTDPPPIPSNPAGEVTISSNANLVIELSEVVSATRVAYAESEIKQLANNIAMLVTDGNGTSLMEQTANGWSFSMADIIDAIDDAENKLGTLYDYVSITTYNGQPCIELGESENEFKLRITNTEIQFSDGTVVPAYISNKKLMIEQAEVRDELQFGPAAGRNLLPRAKYSSDCVSIDSAYSESGYGFRIPAGTTEVTVGGMVEGLNLLTNTQYTVSFTAWLTTTDANAKQSLTWDLWPDTLPQEFIYADADGVTNKPKRYSWIISSDEVDMANCNLRFIAFEQDSEGYTAKYPVNITDIKLEAGNKATKWSPAPEDGNLELHGTWIWKRRTNGNLGLVWKDVNLDGFMYN